jgi:outer membrane protein TolC
LLPRRGRRVRDPPLLQGRPIAVNLASLRQARLDTALSEYEFRGFLEALVADVESTYWECALADRRVRILEEAERLAGQQLAEVEHRIRVGSLAETERASAQAQTALRREALINARSAQARSALDNLADLVRVDVESACLDVERTRAQVSATATTRQFQEEKLRAETAKFTVGRSTALLVAQAQQDLVASQVSEVEAVVRNLQALVALFRREGTLLERRGLSAPGRGAEAPAP